MDTQPYGYQGRPSYEQPEQFSYQYPMPTYEEKFDEPDDYSNHEEYVDNFDFDGNKTLTFHETLIEDQYPPQNQKSSNAGAKKW